MNHDGTLPRYETMTSQQSDLLENFRPYLMLLAQAHLDPRHQRRIDASDIVQQTMMEAHQHFEDYRGQSENELMGWLRKVLMHNIVDAVRAMGRAKRDFRRERSIEAAVDDSFSRAEQWLAADQSTPSQRLMKHERLVAMSAAIQSLPDDQREAVVLHHLQGKSLKELAAHFERSESAAASLLYRGIKAMRENMSE